MNIILNNQSINRVAILGQQRRPPQTSIRCNIMQETLLVAGLFLGILGVWTNVLGSVNMREAQIFIHTT